MAIQIRELIVKANVDRTPQGGESNSVDDKEKKRIKQEILEEAMEAVADYLKTRGLR